MKSETKTNFEPCEGCNSAPIDCPGPKQCDKTKSEKPPKFETSALNDLLGALKKINGICEETEELGDVHTHEEAMASDKALTIILRVCENTLAKYT